jgi:hypothetical protein
MEIPEQEVLQGPVQRELTVEIQLLLVTIHLGLISFQELKVALEVMAEVVVEAVEAVAVALKRGALWIMALAAVAVAVAVAAKVVLVVLVATVAEATSEYT